MSEIIRRLFSMKTALWHNPAFLQGLALLWIPLLTEII
jgi:hypothetical protein